MKVLIMKINKITLILISSLLLSNSYLYAGKRQNIIPLLATVFTGIPFQVFSLCQGNICSLDEDTLPPATLIESPVFACPKGFQAINPYCYCEVTNDITASFSYRAILELESHLICDPKDEIGVTNPAYPVFCLEYLRAAIENEPPHERALRD